MGHSHSHHDNKSHEKKSKQVKKQSSLSDETVDKLRNIFSSILNDNNQPDCDKFIVSKKNFIYFLTNS